MKIGFVTSYLSRAGGGGIVTSIEALSLAVEKQDTEVSVLGLDDKDWQGEICDWRGAEAQTYAVIGPRSIGYSPGLRRALIAHDFDIAHTHGIWMHPSSDVLTWSKGKKPYMVSPHGMLDPWAISLSPWKKRIAQLLYEGQHLQRAACIHALCAAEKEAIRSFGLRNPVCTIPNGVDIPAPGPKVPPPWADQIRATGRVLLFLGRLHPKKNIHGAIEAFGTIASSGDLSDWYMAVAGWEQPGYLDRLKALVANLGLEERVIFLGPLQGGEKHAAMSNAAAFVLPSFSEGLPMAILEAWSYGLPVAMTTNCNLPEGFSANAAFEIRVQSPELSIGLKNFLSMSNDELNMMGLNGFQLASTRFSWGDVAKRFSDVYKWMAGKGVRPECVSVDK